MKEELDLLICDLARVEDLLFLFDENVHANFNEVINDRMKAYDLAVKLEHYGVCIDSTMKIVHETREKLEKLFDEAEY